MRPSGSDGERIEPISFRSGSRYRAFGDKAVYRWMARTLAALILCFLGGGAWFVFTAKQVTIIIDPDPAVPFGHVIDVYDRSRLAGFEQVQFAASEDV